MSLGLVPEVLNPIDVVSAIRKKLRMIDPYVMKVRNIQHIISLPAILIMGLVGLLSESISWIFSWLCWLGRGFSAEGGREAARR